MSELNTTPLHSLHVELGARMVPFAGYDMPLQFPLGLMKEHLHTRNGAGLFDVSHMGQVIVRPKSGDLIDAAAALETLVPVDIVGLKEGRQRYALFTNDTGGIEDDLMVANRGDHLFLVVNAACKGADFERLQSGLSAQCDVAWHSDHALLALQGPASEDALAALAPEAREMRFMDVRALKILGVPCIASRSGYTGEDGYEISIPAEKAVEVAKALLEHDAVEPIGLGARDSLRLEAGLCLYGSDIDTATTPVSASLEWAIQKSRRKGGEREGGFPGADVILAELENGVKSRRVGLRAEGRAPVRAGTQLFESEDAADAVGHVTSGVFGPTISAPVAMGYVPDALSSPETRLFAEVRGKRLPVRVSKMPFRPSTYKR